MLSNKLVVFKWQNSNMILPQVHYALPKIFVIVQQFSQRLQAHKLNMIKRGKLAGHPRTIWRIWACDVTPTSRMPNRCCLCVHGWPRYWKGAVSPQGVALSLTSVRKVGTHPAGQHPITYWMLLVNEGTVLNFKVTLVWGDYVFSSFPPRPPPRLPPWQWL